MIEQEVTHATCLLFSQIFSEMENLWPAEEKASWLMIWPAPGHRVAFIQPISHEFLHVLCALQEITLIWKTKWGNRKLPSGNFHVGIYKYMKDARETLNRGLGIPRRLPPRDVMEHNDTEAAISFQRNRRNIIR